MNMLKEPILVQTIFPPVFKPINHMYNYSFIIIINNYKSILEMAPPKWLVDYWKEEKNWVWRYTRGSDLNQIMCGIPMKDSIWTKKHIREFQAHMNHVKQTLEKDTILYRGTRVLSPTMNEACFTMQNCHYMSTTKSQAIAKEFAGKKDGYIHKLYCKKGVILYDLQELYDDNPLQREKEVLIYPNHTLSFVNKKGNVLSWIVSPHKES